MKEVNGSLVELLIEHWWLAVVVGQAHTLDDVHVKDTDQSDWEHDWHEETVSECNIGLKHNGRVSKVHHVLWSGVQVDVLLVCHLLRFGLIGSTWTAREPTVFPSEQLLYCKSNADFDIWHEGLNHHGLSQGAANGCKPTWREVRVLIVDGYPEQEGVR